MDKMKNHLNSIGGEFIREKFSFYHGRNPNDEESKLLINEWKTFGSFPSLNVFTTTSEEMQYIRVTRDGKYAWKSLCNFCGIIIHEEPLICNISGCNFMLCNKVCPVAIQIHGNTCLSCNKLYIRTKFDSILCHSCDKGEPLSSGKTSGQSTVSFQFDVEF
jgi:hypothetical protein